MPISGYNPVPQGVAGTGAAYVLGRTTPDALSILMQGQRQRAYLDAQQRRQKQAADEKRGKELLDNLKYEVSGSHYFGQPLQEKVYSRINNDLAGIYKEHPDDSMARNLKVAPILQGALSETKQSEAKTKYLDDTMRKFSGDTKLYNPTYATTNLASALRGEDGTGRLPSQFDEEAWAAAVQGDPNLYNEPEVVGRATQRIGHEVSQKISEAGSLGGQHYADTVRGKYVRMQNGKPVLNADGSPALALTPDLQAAFEADPLVKLKLDAREAAYNAKREADPTLPQMTRRGHLAQMVGPFAYYSTSRDEGLNPLPPRPREANPKQIVATPTVTATTSYYRPDGSPSTAPSHYAGVGHSFGSATKPYVDVNVNSSALQVQGRDGQPTKLNLGNNSQVGVRLTGRDYVLYANGKRLGQAEPYANEADAYRAAKRLIADSPHPEKLELRVQGRGVVMDKAKTAGDGLGGGPTQPTGFNPSTGKPTYDTSTSETEHTVTFPMTQEIDATLERATNRAWHHYKASDQERELIKAVKARGGRVVTPYSTPAPAAPAKASTTKRPPLPSFLSAKTPATKAPTKPSTKAADKSGGML